MNDAWLNSVTKIEEPGCYWLHCTKVATHKAVMSKPCEHPWLFCIEHKDTTMERQALAAQVGDGGEWKCPIGVWHTVGLVTKWEKIPR